MSRGRTDINIIASRIMKISRGESEELCSDEMMDKLS